MGQQGQEGHWEESLKTAESGPRESQGHGLTWGPTVQQFHKVGWEGSQLPVLLPQPPAVLNLGKGKDVGASGSVQESLECRPLVLPKDSLLPCCLPFHRPHPPFTLFCVREELQHL